jgi:hypothetical protein
MVNSNTYSGKRGLCAVRLSRRFTRTRYCLKVGTVAVKVAEGGAQPDGVGHRTSLGQSRVCYVINQDSAGRWLTGVTS